MVEYSEEDVGNIISLEHVNVQIADQALATLFYVVGLGGTRDPYLNVGLNNMWVNLGEQQFHLPTRSSMVSKPLKASKRSKSCRSARFKASGAVARFHCSSTRMALWVKRSSPPW